METAGGGDARRTVVFVLGPDRPGIIAAVTRSLFEQGCNLEDVSQTSLQGQFLGIFVAAAPGPAGGEALLGALRARLDPLGLSVQAREIAAAGAPLAAAAEPYVITTVGPDRPGLVAGIAGLLADFGANITNLKAIARSRGEGQEYVTFYELDLPAAADGETFRSALRRRARELGLDVNLQHREIFEQVHRI
ncbi:MAG TPA: ACT domain-containing protein [Candidatus Methanoperedens sp.]|nr:ACT domain-containing protein [Candidatus Methanoperedens sp.]